MKPIKEYPKISLIPIKLELFDKRISLAYSGSSIPSIYASIADLSILKGYLYGLKDCYKKANSVSDAYFLTRRVYST